MTKHVTTIKLTGPLKRRLENLHYVMKCDRCGNPLQAGEKIVSKRKIGSTCTHKYYHKQCWESMFF